MSPLRSRAAIRFIIAIFLAQTFVNAVAVPHPHVHRVLDPRQVVSLPVVERQEPAEVETKNVFDALVDTLKGYNGWQVFQDFFRKLFNGAPPVVVPVVSGTPILSGTPIASALPGVSGVPTGDKDYDVPPVVSAIESIISDILSATDPIVIIPNPTDVAVPTESDGMMSILPIWPITTAIDLDPTGVPSIPSELLTEVLPEITDLPLPTDTPIVIVVPSAGINSSDVGIVLPTGILPSLPSGPLVTDPVIVLPTVSPLFPVENGTAVAPLPGTDVPIVVIPTDILSVIPSASAGISASLDLNATVALPTIGLTVTVDLPTIGTEIPITINATAVIPTPILPGTGVLPTLSIEPISVPSVNASGIETAVAPIGTGILPSIGTGVVSSIIDGLTAVLPIGTNSPLFPNSTDVNVIIVPTVTIGTDPVGTISVGPIVSVPTDVVFPNITIPSVAIPTIVLPSIGTGVETPGVPNITISVPVPVVPSVDIPTLPNVTVSVPVPVVPTVDVPTLPNVTVSVPVITIDIPTLLPEITVTVEPLPTAVTVTDEFTAIPVETLTQSVIVDPIPSDAPVIEFPGIPALRSICRDPTVRQLSLPVLNRFYGPSGYPALASFPGCTFPNERQAAQAPGLLNCTALGREVQACQGTGRRVLLSVKADTSIAVGGSLDFGDPNSDAAPWGGYSLNESAIPVGVYFPNLFDEQHVPSSLAQTLFSLFGEGKTERADLRPLGPDTPPEDGISWITRPLGEEVVIDGFDVQVPKDWEGKYQADKFGEFVTRLRVLNDEAWSASGAIRGGPNDLGADGKGVVYEGFLQKRRVQRIVMVEGFEVLVE